MPRLALFDFDNTLIRGDAGVLFARWVLARGWIGALDRNPLRTAGRLVRMGSVTTAMLARPVAGLTGHLTGNLSRREFLRHAYEAFGGLEADWVRTRLHDFAERHLPRRTKDATLDRLHAHVKAGDTVVVLSSGLRDLIWTWREAVGVEVEVMACELQEDDGELTGEVSGPLDGRDKHLRALAISLRRKLPLETATAYADHHDDLPLLEHVGEPVAVDPTRPLRASARKRGWEVLRT